MWQYQRTEELYHHGILGQKWGIRRYQNPDGTLTVLGRRRANKLLDKYAKVTGKRLRIKNVNDKKPKTINEMSNEELQSKINRIKLEQEYTKMTMSQVPKKDVSRGRKIILRIGKDVIVPSAVNIGKQVTNSIFAKMVNEGFEWEGTKYQIHTNNKKKD